jgi:hypothetical protein
LRLMPADIGLSFCAREKTPYYSRVHAAAKTLLFAKKMRSIIPDVGDKGRPIKNENVTSELRSNMQEVFRVDFDNEQYRFD